MTNNGGIVLGDTIPVLLARYVPQYPILSDRTLVMVVIGVVCVSAMNPA